MNIDYSDYLKELYWCMIKGSNDGEGLKIVKIIKLGDYVNEKNIKHIDYLKLDVEGHELEIIKGCEDFIHNIKYIQFEDFHTFYNGEKVRDIFNYFFDRSFKVYFIGGLPDNYVATKETITTLKEIKKDE